MRRPWLLLGLAAFVAPSACGTTDGPPRPDLSHYDIRLTLEPAAHHVRVTGTVTLPVVDTVPVADTLGFFLHGQLEVRSFGTESGTFAVDSSDHGIRYLPGAVRVVATPAPGSATGEPTEVAFAYEGTITEWPEWSASVIGPGWTELGIYFPWFPYDPELRPFTYSLEVVHDTAYTVAAMGVRETGPSGLEGGRRSTRFRRSTPTNDIVVVADSALEVLATRAGESAFRIAHTALSDSTVDAILSDVSGLQQLYTEWFGPVAGDLLLVASEREQGGGYARMGGLFLAGLEDAAYFERRTGYVRYLGHELAHLWWYRADTNTWEDWLNESLAEYSALRAIRARVGEDEYERRLATKREEAAGMPPVHGFDRNGEHAEAVLYSKGPVLLAELESRIGADAFGAFTRALFERQIDTTDRFLDALETLEGPATRSWFEEQLRTR